MGEIATEFNSITHCTDCAADIKKAHIQITSMLKEGYPNAQIEFDNKHLLIIVRNKKGTNTVALKTGCSVLGHKAERGYWEILPNIDHIFYSLNLDTNAPLYDQFRIFTRREFIAMWENLGLIRYKMSSSAVRKYKSIHGNHAKPNTTVYADTLSVQSFKNSSKKSHMLNEYIDKFPKLSDFLNHNEKTKDSR